MITHCQGTKADGWLKKSSLLHRQFSWQSYRCLLCEFVSRWPKCWANPWITGSVQVLILHGRLWVGTRLPQQVGSLSEPWQAVESLPCMWVVINDAELWESWYGTRQLGEWTFPFSDLRCLSSCGLRTTWIGIIWVSVKTARWVSPWLIQSVSGDEFRSLHFLNKMHFYVSSLDGSSEQ